MSGLQFREQSAYCTLELGDSVFTMTREQIDKATDDVIAGLKQASQSDIVVLASGLESLPEGIVASLDRTEKSLSAGSRHLLLVSDSEKVRSDLSDGGLLERWKVVPDREAAEEYLRSHSSSSGPSSEGASTGEDQPTSSEKQLLRVEPHKRYYVLMADPALAEMAWSDQEAAMTAAEREFRESKAASLLVDLSEMTYINSGMIAGLVRFWKVTRAKEGQFAIVCPDKMVTSVLQASGLSKVWTLTDTREEAAYSMGVSQVALVERRERTFLVSVSLPCAIIAALALVPMFVTGASRIGVNSQLTALLFSAAALATGGVAVFREIGLKRKLAVVAVIGSLCVLSTLWFRENPISFFRTTPVYDLEPGVQMGRPAGADDEDSGDSESSGEPDADASDADIDSGEGDRAEPTSSAQPPAEPGATENTDSQSQPDSGTPTLPSAAGSETPPDSGSTGSSNQAEEAGTEPGAGSAVPPPDDGEKRPGR